MLQLHTTVYNTLHRVTSAEECEPPAGEKVHATNSGLRWRLALIGRNPEDLVRAQWYACPSCSAVLSTTVN